MKDTKLLQEIEKLVEKNGWKVESSDGFRQNPDKIRLTIELKRKRR